MLFKSAIVAVFAALAAAQVHAPVGEPSGNPISKPGKNEAVPKGKAYTITWEATTKNPVSILLVKGPSNNVVPIATLVERLPNAGSFIWTPAQALESTGNAGYGIQIIDDVNGQYQWSTQFGLTGETVQPSSSSQQPGYPTGTPSTKASLSHYPTDLPSSSSKKTSASGYPTTKSSSKSVGTASVSISSGYPAQNTTIVTPTKTPSVPVTLSKTTGTSSTATRASSTTGFPPESTGAAGSIKAGLGLAGLMAAAAAFL